MSAIVFDAPETARHEDGLLGKTAGWYGKRRNLYRNHLVIHRDDSAKIASLSKASKHHVRIHSCHARDTKSLRQTKWASQVHLQLVDEGDTSTGRAVPAAFSGTAGIWSCKATDHLEAKGALKDPSVPVLKRIVP